MNHRIARLFFVLLAFATLDASAAAKKKPVVLVRFHAEANIRDTSTFAIPAQLTNPPREIHIEKVATISERDIEAIYPFRAPDGTMGCAFKLDNHGTFALVTLTTEKKGRAIVAAVNGRQVADMIIDRPVKDGIITIPRGLADAEIALLEQTHPILGRPVDPKKRKKR